MNFGFSFGSPLAESSAPAPLTVVPEAQDLPQIQTAPNTTPPLESSQPLSQGPAVQRTPRSARNKLPARPSTYDIPSDDRGEQTRSNKRRKLSKLYFRLALSIEASTDELKALKNLPSIRLIAKMTRRQRMGIRNPLVGAQETRRHEHITLPVYPVQITRMKQKSIGVKFHNIPHRQFLRPPSKFKTGVTRNQRP